MGYDTSGFLNWLYETNVYSASLQSQDSIRLENAMCEKRKRVRELIGIDKLYSFKFEQSVQLLEERKLNEYSINVYEMEILPKLKFKFYILKPSEDIIKKDTNGYKTVVFCCGHGNGVEEVVTENDKSYYHKHFPVKLARQGYLVITLEFVGFGEVVNEGFLNKEYQGCYSQSTAFLMHGFTMLAMRLFQTQKVVEYAKSEYKISKTALHGISGGGTVATFLSAIDDSYSACAVSGYTNLFKDSILALYHCVDNFVPDILSVGEMPDISALSAPKHLFISSGTNDDIFPVEATREAVRQIRNIYSKLGIEDRISVEIFEGFHEISYSDVFGWLEKVL